jgi:hypothetical protein
LHQSIPLAPRFRIDRFIAFYASQCSSDYAVALAKRFPDPRSAFERAIRASVGQFGATPWKSKAERGEMSRHLRYEAHGSQTPSSGSSMFATIDERQAGPTAPLARRSDRAQAI